MQQPHDDHLDTLAQMSATSSQTQSSKVAATSSSSFSTTLATSTSLSLASSFKRLMQVKVSRCGKSDDEGQSFSTHDATSLNGASELSEQDIDELVVFLLEKLNDYSEEINSLSTAKESLEKELQSLHRALLKQTSNIKRLLGFRAQALIEMYFEKMLRLCMRDLELKNCIELQSDMEDELRIAGATIEQFDTELATDICWLRENMARDQNYGSQLAAHLKPPSRLSLRTANSSQTAHMEIVQRMRKKMQSICEQLCDLHEKISNIKTRYARDRASFDRFCQVKQTDLHQLMPFCSDYFDTRLSSMMLKPKLERLSTKIDRVRRTYTSTMNDLYLVSCFIRQYGHKRDHQGGNFEVDLVPLQH